VGSICLRENSWGKGLSGRVRRGWANHRVVRACNPRVRTGGHVPSRSRFRGRVGWPRRRWRAGPGCAGSGRSGGWCGGRRARRGTPRPAATPGPRPDPHPEPGQRRARYRSRRQRRRPGVHRRDRHTRYLRSRHAAHRWLRPDLGCLVTLLGSGSGPAALTASQLCQSAISPGRNSSS